MKKIIFILFAVFLFQQFYQPASVQQVNDVKHDNVILYATSWCGYCKKTRAFLADNNIAYTEYDIETSEDGRKQHEALGGGGVPVLDIKGTVVHGYSVANMTAVFKALDLM